MPSRFSTKIQRDSQRVRAYAAAQEHASCSADHERDAPWLGECIHEIRERHGVARVRHVKRSVVERVRTHGIGECPAEASRRKEREDIALTGNKAVGQTEAEQAVEACVAGDVE